MNVYLWTRSGQRRAFAGDVFADLTLIQIAIVMIAGYTIFFIGSCSPIHFRSIIAIVALFCVVLSWRASIGFSYYLGFKSSGLSNLLPFLLFGIGVDDCFVIASALDQTDPRDAVDVRMRDAMMHAGTSITITSLTNSLAFFLGCTTSLEGLRSFCFFAGTGVLCIYLTSITTFSAALVWDMRRQINQIGDCCGGCSCREDNIVCCRGRLLSQRQRAYPYRGTLEEAQMTDM